MSAPRRHRLLSVLRVFALAFFAFGLAVQPALVSMAEIHELAHDPSGGHAHIDYADSAGGEHAAGDGEEGPAGTLHMLLQFAHCCGQSAAVLAPAHFAAARPATDAALPQRESRAVLDARVLAPFRPPIPA